MSHRRFRHIGISTLPRLTVLMLFGAAMCAWATPEIPDAEEQVDLARDLEKRGQWDRARAAWERVIDTCEATKDQRDQARRRIAILNDYVPPNIDPANANVWRVYVAIFRILDFEWTPKDSETRRHIRTVTTDDEVKLIKRGFERFADLVFAYSRGQLRLSYTIDVIEKPLTRISGDDPFWLGPWDIEDLTKGRCQFGELDSVFGYVKMRDKAGNDIPAAMFGGSYGGDYGPHGAGWTGIMWCPGWLKGDGEVELHEWLHQVDWSFTHRLGYPDEIVPNPDSGRKEGQEGGYPYYRRKPNEPTWFRLYQRFMSVDITSKMWQQARCRPWKGVEYARTWHLLGPVEWHGEIDAALDRNWGAMDLDWRHYGSDDDYVDLIDAFGQHDNTMAWAQARLHSDADRGAYLWLGYDDSIVAYVNGKQVFRYAGEQAPAKDYKSVPIELKQGENIVALKVLQVGGGWGFYARVGTKRGRPVGGVKWQ